MRRAVCPGSFDPVTNGHLDVVSRAAGLFDHVVVGVLVNESKRSLFEVGERVEMLREAVAELRLANVVVASFDGLLVDFCREQGAQVIVKGLRSGGDVDYELQMAQMNKALAGVDTAFLPTSPAWAFVASTLVKEVARLGGDIDAFVPAAVAARVRARVAG